MNNYEIRHQGELITEQLSSRKYLYLDQLLISDKWVPSYWMKSYLRKMYNMTMQEYYNLVKYGDIHYIHHCTQCSKSTAFKNLANGYMKFCSSKCSYKYKANTEEAKDRSRRQITTYNNIPEIQQLHSDAMRLNNINPEIKRLIKISRTKTLINDVSILAEQNKKYFITRTNKANNISNCILYIAIKDNLCKIGIASTKIHAKQRIGKFNTYNNIVFQGSNINVAELEYLLKITFVHNNEIFNKNELEQILAFIDDSLLVNKIQSLDFPRKMYTV